MSDTNPLDAVMERHGRPSLADPYLGPQSPQEKLDEALHSAVKLLQRDTGLLKRPGLSASQHDALEARRTKTWADIELLQENGAMFHGEPTMDIKTGARGVESMPENPRHKFSATEKQALLEAAGFATDGGKNARADGKVDGHYGKASQKAEHDFAEALADGKLTGVSPDVLAKARAAFSGSIRQAQEAHAHHDHRPSAAPSAAPANQQGAGR